MTDWLTVASGLLTLLVAGDLLVRGAAWLAEAFGVRPMVVGATVVAFGTSAPELAASLVGALEGKTGIATGTVLGSNIANIALILGLAAAVHPIAHVSGSAKFEVRCLLAVTLLSPVPLLTGAVDRWTGLALMAFLVWFTWSLLHRERRLLKAADAPPRQRRGAGAIALRIVFVVAGCAGLPTGATWVVEGASAIAASLGLSVQVISIVIVAVGTSLPELTASVIAARKGHPALALGNVLGSNLFNFCMVLGATATVAPLPVTWSGEGPHILVGIALTGILAYLLAYRGGMSRASGITFLVGYVIYLGSCVLYG